MTNDQVPSISMIPADVERAPIVFALVEDSTAMGVITVAESFAAYAGGR
jgi:hypothetical protein